MLKRSLHYSDADTRASDNSDMNPFMVAVEKGHLEVAKILIREDPGLMSIPLGSGSTVIHWALEKGHSRSAFFEVCFFLLILSYQSLPLCFNQFSFIHYNNYYVVCKLLNIEVFVILFPS